MSVAQNLVQSNSSFQPRLGNIVEEEIDGEVIIINLVSGKYYSLRAEAAVIWNCVRKKVSVEQTVNFLLRKYDSDEITVREAVCAFLEELRVEELIEHCAEVSDASAIVDESLELKNSATAFSAPVLQLYTDMQDLLLLDPIHEVAETGWPSVKDKS